MIRKCLALAVFFAAASFCGLFAVEITKDTFIRLVLDDATGNFSLYYLVDASKMQYEPLFNDKDPSASFSAVSVNGKIHRLGESRFFQTRIEYQDENPAVIHESSSLLITMVYFPVRTVSSSSANGVRIAISIKNKTNEELTVGLRLLIDTHLGEGRGNTPFNTDTLTISKEKLVDSSSGENFWVSRGQSLSLMGSITSPGSSSFKRPDFVHFANWKKLNDVSWKAPYYEGRSFNYTNYSVGDSAVCYYYEPDKLRPNDFFDYEIFLTTEDTAWYQQPGARQASQPARAPAAQQAPQAARIETPPARSANFAGIPAIIDAAVEEAAIYGEDPNLTIFRRLQEVLDKFIAGEIELNEHDLREVEMSIDRYGNR